MKKEWFESERMRAKPDSLFLPARSYGKKYATKLDLSRISPAERDDDVTHLFPLLDKIATFDKIWLAGQAGSPSVVVFCKTFLRAQYLSPDMVAGSVPLWLDKCLVTLRELSNRTPFYQEDVQRWVDSQMPVYAFDLSSARMQRLLIEWAEKPLTTLP